MGVQVCPGTPTTAAWSAAMTVDFGATVTISAAPGPLGALKMGLISVLNGGATPASVFADITLPTYDTYAASATLTWSVQLNETDGSLTVITDTVIFQQTGDAGATIVGAYLWVTGPVVYGLCLFPSPINLVNEGDGFTISAQWNMQSPTLSALQFVTDS
jgi:hypothetical protein